MDDSRLHIPILAALEATSDGWWQDGGPSTRVEVSRRWQQTFGGSDGPLSMDREKWLDCIHPSDRPAWLATLATLTPPSPAATTRLRLCTGGDEWTWVERRVTVTKWSATTEPVATIGCDRVVREAHARPRAEEETRWLRLALESAQVGAFDWRITEGRAACTDEFFRLHGGRFSAWPSLLEFLDAVLPEDQELLARTILAALQGGGAYVAEYRFVLPNGCVRWHTSKGHVTLDDQGRPARLMGMVTDITAQRAADQVIRARERFDLIIRASNDGIFDWSLNGGEAYSSARLFEQLELTPGRPTAVLAGLRRHMHPEDRPVVRRTVADSLRSGSSLKAEFRLARADGDYGWFIVQACISRNEAGRAIRVTGSVRDVTRKRLAESRLRLYADEAEAAKAKAEAALRAKDAFLATMSHEIRTPLNGVLGMTTLLLDTPLTAEQREYAETVRQSSESLLAIVNDILDFSKIEAGRLELEYLPVELVRCVEESLDVLAVRAGEKHLDLAYRIEPNVPAWVRTDVTRLRQILINLVGNAIKFTPKGEVVVRVSAESAPNRDTSIRFDVTDSGIGIGAEGIARLFRTFSQADMSTTRKYGGTGLGLSICKRLTEAMGGRIWVESEPGRGSTFSFTIAATRVPAPAGHVAEPLDALTGRNLWLTADGTTSQSLLVAHMTGLGACVRLFDNLSVAAAALAASRPDAILHFWPTSQHSCTKEAISVDIETFVDVPLILVCSPQAQVDDYLRSTTAGIVRKPLRPFAIYRVVAQVLAAREEAESRATRPQDVIPIDRPTLVHRILIAEDNVVNQRLARALVEKLGFACVVVDDGAQALDAAERGWFSAILMDCQMPEMDGFDATVAIRHREQTLGRPRIPIIALTAGVTPAERARCHESGMDDFLSKPVRLAELKDTLERWTRRSGLAQRPA